MEKTNQKINGPDDGNFHLNSTDLQSVSTKNIDKTNPDSADLQSVPTKNIDETILKGF